MWQSYVLAIIYLLTMKIGISGNLWVIFSVIRNARPRKRNWSKLPSDRLRSYIFILAIIDLIVVCSLIQRIFYLCNKQQTFEIWNCRGLYLMEQISKLASMFCLGCISIGRYITIRKPFSNQVRKHFYQSIPIITLLLYFFILIPLLLTVEAVDVTADKSDCRISNDSIWSRLTSLFVGTCFIMLLMFLSVNYGEIVRHVRRKFVRRKARESANDSIRQRPVAEPLYMREMTSSIVRVAAFHMICWLPFCFIMVVPTKTSSILLVSIRTINQLEEIWTLWIVIIANWLTYLNSALNWIFYAVLNRDLRTLIRSSTARRRRGAMTYSYNLRKNSLRQCFGQKLSTLNSYTNPKSIIVSIETVTDNECSVEPKILISGQQNSITESFYGDYCITYNTSSSS